MEGGNLPQVESRWGAERAAKFQKNCILKNYFENYWNWPTHGQNRALPVLFVFCNKKEKCI